ncbi:hypothetical protein [Lentilactobacillus otakiensis]|uniref:hypothetical protein n=1 Tax=Lentilactobacillus otakiensis TaxID=481720 RepID=UPI003D186C22
MNKNSLSVIILNWAIFIISPLVLLLINSFTFYQIFATNARSGSFLGTQPLLVNFVWNVLLLVMLNYFTTWKFAKKRFTSAPINSMVIPGTTMSLIAVIIVGVLVADITRFSIIGEMLIALPEVLSIPWMLYLTYNAWRYQNIRFLGLTISLQTFYICLLMNNFYSFTN